MDETRHLESASQRLTSQQRYARSVERLFTSMKRLKRDFGKNVRLSDELEKLLSTPVLQIDSLTRQQAKN